MVAKGTKRKASEADVAAEKCQLLAQAITEAATVPTDVVTMLVDVLPHSLGQPKDKRHCFQERAISAVDSVLMGVEDSLKKNIEEARTRLLEAKNRAAPCEAAVGETETKLKEDSDRFSSETKALAKATLSFRAARTAVEDSKKSQVTGDQDSKVALTKKAKLQAVVDDLIEPLKKHTVPAEDLEQQVKALLSELKQLEFDEAILMVLASSFSKAPAARGGFDHMAIEQLEKNMAQHIDPLDTILNAEESGRTQRASAVTRAHEALEASLQNQKMRADAFESAWNAKKLDEHTLTAAKQALKDLASSTKTCTKSLYAAEADADVFKDGARFLFEELKERSTPEPVPEPVAEPVPEPMAVEQPIAEAVVAPQPIAA